MKISMPYTATATGQEKVLPDSLAALGDTIRIYWHGLLFAAALIAAVLAFRSLLAAQKNDRREAETGSVVAGLLCIPLGVLGARALYCVFTPDAGGLFHLSSGGYALYGGAAGVILGLFITSLATRSRFSDILDAAAPASALAIVIGRLAACFSHEELGYIIEKPKWQFFPFSVYIESEGCWRMCVFTFEALAALIALVMTLWLFNAMYISRSRGDAHSGDVFIMLVLIYSSSQTLLESWRTDTMTMRNNAFVRISQVLSAVFLAAALVVVYVRACRAKKKTVVTKDVIVWGVSAGLLAVAFVMEFGKNKETMLRNNWFMFFTLFPLSIIGIAALLGAFRFDAEVNAVNRNKPAAASYQQPRRGGGRQDDEPTFDDDFDEDW